MAVREGAAETERLSLLSAAARALAEGATLGQTLEGIAAAAADALNATVAVARVADEDRCLRARAVVADSTSLAAELAASSIPASEVPEDGEMGGDYLPDAVRESAERAGAEAVLLVPVTAAGKLLGSLELLRPGEPFNADEREVARIVADHLAAAIRRFDGTHLDGGPAEVERALELAGEALVAGGEAAKETEVARVAYHASGAAACLVWRRRESGELELAASIGGAEPAVVDGARPLAEAAVVAARSGGVESVPGGATVVTFALGQPARHVLQLAFPDGVEPSERLLTRLGTFAARAAQALRAGELARTLGAELARTRTLLEVVAQASEELSLAHALETALERVAEVLDAERVCIYLWRDGHLHAAASRSLAGSHEPVAERLLELVLGPKRGRGILVLDDVAADPAFAALDVELAETAIEGAAAVPLLVPGEVVGLLAVYLPAGRLLSRNERSLLAALAAQLAVSVQNARLHEEATQLRDELEEALKLERQAARQLGSLYEISRSFAQSLSLEATLEAAATTVVDLLDVDAAVLRMRDARGEALVPRALHVADVRVADALRAIVSRPNRSTGCRSGTFAPARRSRSTPSTPRGSRPTRRCSPSWRRARRRSSSRSRPRRSCWARSRSSRSTPPARSRRRRPRSPSRSRRRPRSPSTTRGSTSSRRSSPTRCSARCSRTRSPTSRAWRSAMSTPRRRTSTSAATSTTSSRSETADWPWCSATSRATASTPPPTWP